MTRKLDTLVANEVMGQFAFIVEEYAYITNPDPLKITMLKEVPHYSTDIAAAWGVVEKLGSMWMDHTEPRDGITVDFHHGPITGTADEATAPLAICVAALRVVGVDEAEIQEAMSAPATPSP